MGSCVSTEILFTINRRKVNERWATLNSSVRRRSDTNLCFPQSSSSPQLSPTNFIQIRFLSFPTLSHPSRHSECSRRHELLFVFPSTFCVCFGTTNCYWPEPTHTNNVQLEWKEKLLLSESSKLFSSEAKGKLSNTDSHHVNSKVEKTIKINQITH